MDQESAINVYTIYKIYTNTITIKYQNCDKHKYI